MRLICCLLLTALLILGAGMFASNHAATAMAGDNTTGYRKPPAAILDVLNAPVVPTVSLDPTRTRMLLVRTQRYPEISELAQPMLRLAGLRINPNTKGPHRQAKVQELTLVDLASGQRRPVQLPAEGAVGVPSWAPDGSRFAFTLTKSDSIELHVVDTSATEPKAELVWLGLNATLGSPFTWLPDSATLLCKTFDLSRGAPPPAPVVPSGPVIQESYGKQAPVRTYQDLLQDAHDEALFEHYTAAHLVLVDLKSGDKRPLVKTAASYSGMEPSPDGKFVLLSRIERPYSYLHSVGSFPRTVDVVDLAGKLVYSVAKLPLQDEIPIEGVPTGPRQISWRPNANAELYWVEALDGGNPKTKVAHRDKVMACDLSQANGATAASPREVLRTEQRYRGITFSENPSVILYRDYDRDTRISRTFLAALKDGAAEAGKLLFERSIQDRYGDPGSPMMKRLPNGEFVMIQQGDEILLSGPGASPQGDRPFLDRFNLASGKAERIWQAPADAFESIVALLDDSGRRFVTRRESPATPPNYFEVAVKEEGVAHRELTNFADPTPQIRGIKKQLVRYQRPDGVKLSFTLYLPPNYQEGTRLPAVVWAYPREFNDPNMAGQVIGSPQRFTTLGGTSHLFFLLAGYAVLDDATMPVVGDPETANNTFVEQIVASAKAAIDQADEMGVIDPKRVGVGGHSYGAFMTANLLAHSDLFRAGIARSGAFNRTLTPFGFQNERRTLWEAPEIYSRMSPFMFAHQIKAPLLLIHGAADNNPGTFPIQSERLYHAIRGNGGSVRFVSLPYESHGYAARESIEHCLYEMISWFDQHVKDAK